MTKPSYDGIYERHDGIEPSYPSVRAAFDANIVTAVTEHLLESSEVDSKLTRIFGSQEERDMEAMLVKFVPSNMEPINIKDKDIELEPN